MECCDRWCECMRNRTVDTEATATELSRDAWVSEGKEMVITGAGGGGLDVTHQRNQAICVCSLDIFSFTVKELQGMCEEFRDV